MTDTKNPTTTVAQDVEALRAVLNGQHAQTESAAEVLADRRRKVESIKSTTRLGYQTGPYAYAGEDMGEYLREATNDCRDILQSLDRLSRSLAAGKVAWQPIETAPKDNKVPLYLARFNEAGELVGLDYDGIWQEDRESWEMPQVYHYWASANGIEEPTHWAYQADTSPPADPAKASEPDLHPKTADLVNRFARALAEKLSAAEKKYGYSDGWSSPDWLDECRAHLVEHVAKGDPRDVAAYCAFLWHHGSHTDPRSPFCEKCGSAEACDCTKTAKASGSAPDGWRNVLKRAREGLGAGGALGVPGSRQRELEVEIGGMLLDHIEDGLEALTATPPASAPEVTESVREKIDEIANNLGETINHGCDQDAVNRINGYIDQLFALTAALQEKNHD